MRKREGSFMLTILWPEALNVGRVDENEGMLVAFLRADDEKFSEQIRILEEVAGVFSRRLRVGIADENFLPVFFERFGFRGTPFFLLIGRGEEKARFLGHATRGELEDFVARHLPPDEERGLGWREDLA